MADFCGASHHLARPVVRHRASSPHVGSTGPIADLVDTSTRQRIPAGDAQKLGSWPPAPARPTVGGMFEREDHTERCYVDAHGPDDDAVKVALAWAVRFATEHGHRRAMVFTSTLSQVDSLANILGANPAKLRRDRSFRVGNVTVDLVTERQASTRRQDGPVVGLWVDDQQLEMRLDGLDAPALCVVPWNRADIEQWKANWNPADLRTGKPAGQAVTIGNLVVEAAMRSLTVAVNLSTGLSHPSDKEAAVQTFRLLRDSGERFEPSEVQAWAVRNGWRPRHARELAEVAQAIIDRRAIRGGRPRWRKDIVEYWREEARSGGAGTDESAGAG